MSDPEQTKDVPEYDPRPRWQGKLIAELTDDELLQADNNFTKIKKDLDEKRQHPKFKERMKNQPAPTVNPAFNLLQTEISNELKKRIEANG